MLLANCKANKREFLHLTPFEYAPINVFMGDTLRPTATFTNFGTMRLSFDILFNCRIRGMVLFITNEGLAHVGLLDDYAQEQYYFELPSVWQYHDREDDDALSIPERREQEIPFMYILAEL